MPIRTKCPKCGRRFQRLDTHLRVSAICRDVAGRSEDTEPPPTGPMNIISCTAPVLNSAATLTGNLNFAMTLPGNLNSAVETTTNLSTTTEECNRSSTTAPSLQVSVTDSSHYSLPASNFTLKPRLCLPKSHEDWEKANHFFEQHLIPLVISELSVDSKYTVLAEGVFDYFSANFGSANGNPHHRQRQNKHQSRLAGQVREAKALKNEARRVFEQAKKSTTLSQESINTIAKKFFQSVRSHNKLIRAHRKSQHATRQRSARRHCHENLWRFTKDLLDDDTTSNIQPTFSEPEATSFFSTIYHSEPQSFTQPSWLPSASAPEVSFNEDDISMAEIDKVVKKSRSNSSPSPVDGLPYSVFKNCPSLLVALHNIFNLCWATSVVPSAWKFAAIRLIGKTSASSDPSSPTNFRPIALTACVGKLFTAIIRNRFLNYMLINKYFDKSVQKAFMPATPGCSEHHLKLTTILSDAKRKHRSLAACWVDLANAYGSVHHSLIQFSLTHYHAPSKLYNLVKALYTGLAARVTSTSWSTPLIPIQLGVYQGDPLSVVIFNTVINTLVDTLQTRRDLGYRYSQRQLPINLLQYADDTCLIGNSPVSCQHLLDMTAVWLQWSGMRAKITKCAALGLQGSSGKKIDPRLFLNSQQIPYAPRGVKFLGLAIDVPPDKSKSRAELLSKFECMLAKVDACPLTSKQKLLIYRSGVCPRLNWLLTVVEFSISWIQKSLDSLASRYLKHWSGLARPANTALLFLSGRKGGLNLPLPSTMHKRLQSSRQSQLLTSSDSCVRFMAEEALQNDLSLSRPKFKASREVREVMLHNPDFTRKSLVAATKLLVTEEVEDRLFNSLQHLEKQGHMSRCSSPDGAKIWAKALESAKDEHLKFVLNSAVDTLPHNANLALWRKRVGDSCPLCGERQTLIHVLNSCKAARDGRRFNARHDTILAEIVSTLSSFTAPSANLSADLGSYVFPHHIVPTDLRPDIVCWDDVLRKIVLIELTICFETSFLHAAERKSVKYEDLVARARSSGYSGRLITLQVGSRGIIDQVGFHHLQQEFNIPKNQYIQLLHRISLLVIEESYKIWCQRNYSLSM